MKYEHMVTGTFLERPNRFIAHVRVQEQTVVCHVKNTGRCRELLIAGCRVVLQFFPDAAVSGRKTEYDLIGVYKGDMFVNMDSQAPNKAAFEWVCGLEERRQGLAVSPSGGDELWTPAKVRREVTHEDSRFDLAFTLKNAAGDEKPAFMEVKGVTLERDGGAYFPDAPTERGIKHLHGLIRAKKTGFAAYILFVIQLKGVTFFAPNDETHPAFGAALREAAAQGVQVLAYDCAVTETSMELDKPISLQLNMH